MQHRRTSAIRLAHFCNHIVTPTKQQLTNLRKRLPRGYQAKVQSRLKSGVSLEFIRLVAHGQRYSQVVMDALLSVAEDNLLDQRQIQDRMQRLAR